MSDMIQQDKLSMQLWTPHFYEGLLDLDVSRAIPFGNSLS